MKSNEQRTIISGVAVSNPVKRKSLSIVIECLINPSAKKNPREKSEIVTIR
jgi:hypothetical protein